MNDSKLMIADNCYKNRFFDTQRGNLLSVCFHVKIRKACSYTGRKRAAVPLRVRVSQSIFQFISIIFFSIPQQHNSFFCELIVNVYSISIFSEGDHFRTVVRWTQFNPTK